MTEIVLAIYSGEKKWTIVVNDIPDKNLIDEIVNGINKLSKGKKNELREYLVNLFAEIHYEKYYFEIYIN